MSTKQPVFFLANTNRKEQFLIETRIWQRKNSFYAEKRPANTKAETHLKNMFSTYTQLEKIKDFTDLIQIVPARGAENSIKFDFIVGDSCERLLIKSVLNRDWDQAQNIIEKLFTLIDALPSANLNPAQSKNYRTVFGNSFNKNYDCTSIGLIDLNLDNIIIDKANVWHLYDYEWCFDFAVPKEFLKMRAIWYFLTRYRELLRYHAARLDCLKVGDKIFIPSVMYKHYGKLFKDLKNMQIAEMSFQIYATGSADKKLGSLNGLSLNPAPTSIPKVGIEFTFHNLVHSETKKLKEELLLKIDFERKHRETLQKRLDQITSSKSYRLAQKAAKLKKKLLDRK